MPSDPDTTMHARIPNGHSRTAVAGLPITLLLLAACATSGPSGPELPSALARIEATLPGRYVSVTGDGAPAQSLTIESRSGTDPATLDFEMRQRGDDGGTRRFGLKIGSGSGPNRFDGEFAPLDSVGNAVRSCAMRFHVRDEGLIGETDPAECRFGEGDEATGLLKEIAFDGRRLVIGERLVDPQDGSGRKRDEILTFLPAPDYSGWLGVRDGHGEDWRVARELALAPGEAAEPLDAAEMTLGVRLDLNYYRMERDEEAILMRLTVTDSDSGELIGEAWAAPGSPSIGLALPELQVGLDRTRR